MIIMEKKEDRRKRGSAGTGGKWVHFNLFLGWFPAFNSLTLSSSLLSRCFFFIIERRFRQLRLAFFDESPFFLDGWTNEKTKWLGSILCIP